MNIPNPRSYGPGHRGCRPQTREERAAYFWSRIKKVDDGCWTWCGALVSKRYGAFYFENKRQLTHRVAWQLAVGPIPDGLNVLHKCDNVKCCRPDHLFLGTQLENVRDMHAKGRAQKALGEKNFNSKLTRTKVARIKKMLRKQDKFDREIAAKFGVARVTINHIRTGRTWRHVK